MQGLKTLLLIIFCILCAEVLFAQPGHNSGKSMYTRTRYNYSSTRVRGAKAKTICPVFQNSRFPYFGLGVKLGDPFAATFKYYPNKHLGLVVDFGKASSGLYNRYFREQFASYQRPDTLSTGASVNYLTHKVKSDLVGEAKILYHIDAKKISEGLQFYVGAGFEWKRTSLDYDYLYETDPLLGDTENRPGRISQSRFTMGPQGIIGIEYSYFQLPISAFMELEYFVDVFKDPGWSRTQGGVGLRYIF
jgi:hypothetical protein